MGSIQDDKDETIFRYNELIKRLNFLLTFIETVPFERPVRITVEYQLENYPSKTQEHVVLINQIDTSSLYMVGQAYALPKFSSTIHCRLLASKERYFGGPYTTGSGHYFSAPIDHIIKWEVIPDDEVPKYMRAHPFVEQPF